MSKRKVIGEILLDMGLITAEQQKIVLDEQAKTGEKFGTILVKKQ